MAQSPSTTTIISSSPSSRPPTDLPLARELAAIRMGMREGGLTAKLPAELEAKISGRLALLRACMKHASISELEEQVAKLMLAYPSTGGHGDVSAMLRVRQYAEDLLETPLWAVKEACRDVSRGAVPGINRDFAPSSPRLREVVDGYVSAVHQEARQIKEVLQAPVVLPDNPEMAEATRKTVGEGLRALAQKIRDDDEALRRPALVPEGGTFKAPSVRELAEIYQTRRLPGLPPRNVTSNDGRNVTDDDDATVDRAGYLQAGE